MRRIFLSILALLVVASCSSEEPGWRNPAELIPSNLKSVFQKKQQPAPAANPMAGLTREQLKDIPGPLLFAYLELSKGAAALGKVAENNGVQTFLTADNVSVALDKLVVLSTRGLGADLLSSDVSGSNLALASRGAKGYGRTMRWLDAQDHTVTGQYTCDMVLVGQEKIEILGTKIATRHFQETCRADGEKFENDYWMGQRKPVIWKSRQWISKETGHIQLVLLIEETQS